MEQITWHSLLSHYVTFSVVTLNLSYSYFTRLLSNSLNIRGMSLITLKMQSKDIFYHILVSRLMRLIKVGVKTYFTNRKELTESFHLDNISTHSCIQPERQSLKDLNPAKIQFHSSTDAIAYAIHLYTNATNSVCYVSTRNSLSHFYSSHGLQNTLVWCRLT